MTDEKKSFWSGASGFIAGVTALVTAVGGLIAILIQVGVFGGNGGPGATTSAGAQQTTAQPGWAQDANDICARNNDAIDALPDAETLDPQAAVVELREALRINKRMVRNLAALTAPPARKADAEEFVRLGAQMNGAAEEMLAAVRVGDVAVLQRQATRLKRLAKSFDDAAISLGATTCAEGASLSDLNLGGA
jgi:hypothetical protein